MAALITLLYPFAIWFGHGRFEPRLLVPLLVLTALMRLSMLKKNNCTIDRWWLVVALLLAALATAWNSLLPMQLYPVLVSVAMFCLFGQSLIFPPSFIERIARLRESDLAPTAIIYTRRVTQVWCIFFAINGSIALITALWASPAIWSLYNGVISYALMGLLFSGEYLVRLRFKRRHHV